ncbi:DNA polymerase IV (plasmid) [Persicobacter psychrovividus]|uniref:DNA polymerase IV n=2 Tax=Persicobacter psychrovividus TaxID=387638 RepID=A0ABM7VJA8_9BACT|nr:DNA polymerase IV [Persicobacter psychrovividus]
MDLDSFFVSVERLRNSELNNIPLIIGGKSNRGVVASCSYEARQFGVKSAMPIRMAKMLCPHATILSGDMEQYSQHSRLVTEIIADHVPLFEKASIDEFYVDLTGMDRFYGCHQWAVELRQKVIKESGLPISFGLSVNKLIAKMGTNEGKPNGAIRVPVGHEKAFISPLSVRKIPMVGQKTYQTLSAMGVRTISTLQQIPRPLLEREFGRSGIVLHQKSHAIDHSLVTPYSEQKSASKEQTFQHDTIDVEYLKSKLVSMTEDLAYELRKQKKLTGCITVKIRYSDFNTVSKQQRIAYTSHEDVLIRIAKGIFDQLHDRRVLVRLIGIRFSHLVQGSFQIDLFEDNTKSLRLHEAKDLLRQKYGEQVVRRAVSLSKARM